MKPRWFRWWWPALLIPLLAGLARLRFDVDPLDLLPADVPAVAGLKIYQQHFANARELIITISAPDAARAERAARTIAGRLRPQTNLVAAVDWQPPWLEHPEQATELIAYLWLNQPPEILAALETGLAETNLVATLAATRERLATTLSPQDLAQWSYDPLGFSQLPIGPAMPELGRGSAMFASPDGAFRTVFISARHDLPGYRECTAWLQAIQSAVGDAGADFPGCHLGYTGRPVFVAEISAGMRYDITSSVVGTSVIIALLFWFAHRRVKPMLWLLTLLAVILASTLALGGLIFGTVSVISMGFAAILLGLAVDYAVVHYQEALAQPELTVPQIRRAIAPSIFWAAVTTISAFMVLNFGGLPGLGQLGSLVGIGVALAALVMIFAFLPPLFPDRMGPPSAAVAAVPAPPSAPPNPLRTQLVVLGTALVVVVSAAVLARGLPGMDASTQALEPRGSQAYAALAALKQNLGQAHEPFWLVAAGRDEGEVARKLEVIEPVLERAVTNGLLSGYASPLMLWPRPDRQTANRAAIGRLLTELPTLRAAVLTNGFTPEALGMMNGVMETWRRAVAGPAVFWPSNQLCDWIFQRIAARESNQVVAAAFLFPTGGTESFAPLNAELPAAGVWLSSWEILGTTVLDAVKKNLWKLLLPMGALILLSLGLAFRRWTEVLLSLAVLGLSGICLLAVMKTAGWSWNVLNLMALPLVLGTGVDYSIFMQLALRRHAGDLAAARRSVGRALLLCGSTAVAGFGSLGLSSNGGMAGLGRVCSVGIAANVLLSVFALPVWWHALLGPTHPQSAPSQLYRERLWRWGLAVARRLPPSWSAALARCGAAFYWRFAAHRRGVVVENLLPVLDHDRPAATRAARELVTQFALKLADLWRYESGVAGKHWFSAWQGWENYTTAQARGKGVLLITPHLGNWELGGAFLTERGFKLLVLTQREPDDRLTALRQASRARWGVETLVIGEDPFAILEIIKRLAAGATVALLVDRPPAGTGVPVQLFGRPFTASIAAAELARASGCALLPVVIVRRADGYAARIFPELAYDRAAIGNRAGRVRLTAEIVRVFEPAIRQDASQWFHFVPVWPSPLPPV